MEDVFMDLFTLLTLAVGLAMDAFAVSICKGLAMREKVLKKGIIVGLWFGGFQALMLILISKNCFINALENLALTLCTWSFLCKVVNTKYHIL